MRYGYARCSTKRQNKERQIEALHKYGLTDDAIFIDMESGKVEAEERTNYAVLRKCLREGDELVIDALDRIGRKKIDIKEEIRYLQGKGIRLIVLSLPTTTVKPEPGQEWVHDMITNLLVEVYSSMAEQELVEKERRTRAGIEIAKAEGKYKGRKPIGYDAALLKKIYPRWKNGGIRTAEFRQLLGLKPNTFYRAIAALESETA